MSFPESRRFCRLLLILAVVADLIAYAACCAEDTDSAPGDSTGESGPSAVWLQYYCGQAADYQFKMSDDAHLAFTLHTDAILTYSNPERLREQHGAVFVWTKQGRPEVVGTVWSKLTGDGQQRRVAHEFHSLSADRVHGERAGIHFWDAPELGIDPQPVSGAPEVATMAPARLLQMRALAREFSATAREANGAGLGSLRLLPRPLFHYEAPEAGVLSGALFAFVMATDPELVLLLEARRTEAGPVWHYAAARFTTVSLQLNHHGREVWQCPARTTFDGDEPYAYDPQVFLRDPDIDDSGRESSPESRPHLDPSTPEPPVPPGADAWPGRWRGAIWH